MPDRKPLELVVHRHVRPGEDGFWNYRLRVIESRKKRLTDPELAAEYHAAVLDVYRSKVHGGGDGKFAALDRMQTVRRFATHPHHDVEESL